MKATLEFKLPEEHAEHEMAIFGGALFSVIHDFDQKLRAMLKYDVGFGDVPDDEKKMTVQEVRDMLWDYLNEDKNVAALFE